MRWLIGSAPDFRGRDPRFESSISHNDRDELQDNCVIKVEKNLRVEKETYPCGKKRSKNIYIYNLTNKGRSPFPTRDIFLRLFSSLLLLEWRFSMWRFSFLPEILQKTHYTLTQLLLRVFSSVNLEPLLQQSGVQPMSHNITK